MQFIIMDLEWNNAFCPETRKGMNEIIEIGAVRLDESLRETSTFSELIRCVLGRRLHERVTALTHLTDEDLTHGRPFLEVLEAFSRWVGDEPVTILSWSNTDLYVLVENLTYFTGEATIPFIRQYADLQRYCQARLGLSGQNQVSLFHAAQQLGIAADESVLHRALDDCRLSAQCLKSCYDPDAFRPFVVDCDDHFYGVLNFRPYLITDFSSPALDKAKLTCTCDDCRRQMKRVSKWETHSGSFRAVFRCGSCNKKTKLVVRAKQYYDRVDTKIRRVHLPETKRVSSQG